MKIVADSNIPFVEECFSTVGEVVVCPGREMSSAVVADADVLLVRSVTKVGEPLLAGSAVKFVGTATIGFEHVDIGYLAERGIAFASAPGSNANSVAEYIVAALLAVARKHRITLAGKSIGIVGVGNVGRRVEQKVRALGMQPVLNDPPLQRETGDAKYVPLERVFDCDFITLHTPLSFAGADKTFHLADEAFFKSLKDGCVFLNTSRGGVMHTAALKAAIDSRRLGPAVLDVWENEPNIDVELLRIVDLSTPHIAGYSFDGKVAGMMMIYEAVCEHFDLDPARTAEDFLPTPEVAEITMSAREIEGRDEQEMIREVVGRVYVINRDDFNTREIAIVPEAERGKFFDDLRKNYKVRREFQNTEVVMPEEHKELAEKLKGIGFKVRHGK